MTSDTTVELYIDGEWVDVTRLDDDTHVMGDITITRGASDEQGDPAPTEVSFRYLDNNLTLDGENPLSVYYRKVGLSTPMRIIRRPSSVTYPDTFTRVTASGWGVSDNGPGWAVGGTTGSSADFATGSGVGTQSVPAVNAYKYALFGTTWPIRLEDVDVYVEVTVAEPTGGPVEPTLGLRMQNTSTYLMARADIQPTTNIVNLELRALVSGSETLLASTTTSVVHAAGTVLKIRAQTIGPLFQARVWQGSTEPTTWDVTVTQTSVPTAGWTGVRSGLDAANTNALPVVFSYDNFETTPLYVRAVVELTKYDVEPGEIPTVNYVNVEGAGRLRALDQGQKPLKSALYRAIERSSPAPKYWWALEGGSGRVTSSVPSTLPGKPALVAAPASAGNDPDARNTGVVGGGTLGPPGGGQAIDLSGGGQLSVPLSGLSSTGPLRLELSFVFNEPVGEFDNGQIIRLRLAGTLIGVFAQDTPGGELVIDLSTDTASASNSSSTIVDDGDWHRLRLDLAPSAGSVDYDLWIDGTIVMSGVSVTWNPATELVISPTGEMGAVSNLVIWDGTAPTNVDTFDAHDGYAGETVGDRMTRLAEEQDETFVLRGNADATAAIDYQDTETFLDLMRSAAQLDMGILSDTRNDLSLQYRTLFNLYNQRPLRGWTLEQIQKGFRPVSNDLRVVNDVVADRPGGASVEYAIPDGDWFHYSTEQPPDGAGFRDTQDSVPAASDGQLLPQAGWRAHVGSWREKRFGEVTFELAKEDLGTFSAFRISILEQLDLGDLLVLDTSDGPAYVPYSEVRLMIRGYTERLGRVLQTITFNTTPADVYEVAQVDALDSQLAGAINNASTTVLIAPPSTGPAWSTAAADLPYHIQINGEPATVTAISTATPTFVAAGANAAGNNASVAPALPAGIAAGNLMLLFAGIRNSGTGTVGTNPTGWTTLVDFGNIRVMYRYFQTGDAAPTVTFSGGVANADTFARTFGFTNLSHVIVSGTKAAPAASTSLNSSAQNMAYSAFSLPTGRTGVSLIFAWKQDDWTGVAPPSGFTEMDDTAATTGDDIGHAAYYDLTGVSEAAGSLVVTGGASAISRTIALHLAPLQSATVTRAIAGSVTSHSPGEEIHGWRMGVNGL